MPPAKNNNCYLNFFAKKFISFIFAGKPAKWTGEIQKISLFFLRLTSSFDGLKLIVSNSISENKGSELQYKAAFDVERKVIGEVIIFLFSFIDKAMYERCKPAVALDTATAYLAPT